MRNRPGISVDDLAWIQRDQFVHYLTVARAGHDPADWPIFRAAVLAALVAAFGLEPDDPTATGIVELLDTVHQAHDPRDAWPEWAAPRIPDTLIGSCVAMRRAKR